MDNPLHAAYYADGCVFSAAAVLQKKQLADQTFLVRIDCPDVAKRIAPGQFMMVRAPGCAEPLLGRAFAMYDVGYDGAGQPRSVDIVFTVVGKLTSRLANMHTGDPLELWGPLGNGFWPPVREHLIMVAGGIGQTPFLALGKEHLGVQQYGDPPRKVNSVKKVTLCYGARKASRLAGVEDFRSHGIEVLVATDDGSIGHHGFVTAILEQVLQSSTHDGVHVVCCGPEPMMAATAKVCGREAVSCQVSLETPMACGLGICFSCVARVRVAENEWDYKRTCVEGPVFDAQQIIW